MERLYKGEILVADGAMGTMLFKKGIKAGMPPESLNLTNQEVLQEIALVYLEAGADIIQTNTFGGSPMKLAEYGLDNKTEEININAVEIVRKTIGNKAYMSASCGPSGKILQPFGDADPEEVSKGFKRQIMALLDAGVDLICIETMTDLREAIIAVEAVRLINSHIPIISTMTFDETPRGFFTVMGNSIEDVEKGLREAGADILGSNCGHGVEKMVKIAREFKKVSTSPLAIQSNAGTPELKDGKLVYPETPEFFSSKVPEFIEAGVSIIGGCCGTTPEHIRAIRNAVDAHKKVDCDN